MIVDRTFVPARSYLTWGRIVQHIPDFCEGFERKEATFDSLAALLAIPWVAEYIERPSLRFCRSGNSLMVAEPKWAWVIGYVKPGLAIASLPDYREIRNG